VCLRTSGRRPRTAAIWSRKILDVAGQKGTGLWTVVSALEMGMPWPPGR